MIIKQAGLNEIYQLIADITSVEDALEMHHYFKGMTITFPTKLINVRFIKEYLMIQIQTGQSFSSRDIQQLAREVDYSERQIRRFLSDVRKECAS